MYERAKLEARVKAVNEAHKYANELYGTLVAIFRPLVGQQIEKQGGDLLAKVKKLIPEPPHSANLRVWKTSSAYSLAWGDGGRRQ